MRALSELNLNEHGRPVRRAVPTPELIAEFEARYAVTLPNAYLTLLRHSNGGHPELDSIQPLTEQEAGRWAVNWFYHLDNDKTSANSLWVAMERWRSILGEHSIPFASDGGGNQFFLDLRANPPAVRVCVHDQRFQLVDIAPSFESFIDRLENDPDMI